MRFIPLLLLAALSTPLSAQWKGDTAKYDIFPDSLQLNEANSSGGMAYLSQESTVIEDATWEFNVNMRFNPSGSNYAKVYLVADNSDLSGNGYYVKVGGSDDKVSLFRQDGIVATEIIAGTADRVDFSNVSVRIKVTRIDGQWELFSNVASSGYVKEGSSSDFIYLQSAYFGVQSVYTKSRSDLFSYAQFSTTGTSFVDDVAPRLDSLVSLTQYQCRLYFNENINVNSISYNGVASKKALVEGKMVTVLFDSPFLKNDSSELHIEVSDMSDNAYVSDTKIYYKAYEVSYASMQSATQLEFVFNKNTPSVAVENITLDGLHPITINLVDGVWNATFSKAIELRTPISLKIENVSDNNGDLLQIYTSEVSYFEFQKGDVVINELMPDPSPQLGTLPLVEYVELYNNNATEVVLTDWYLQRDSTTIYALPFSRIEAHGYLLLVNESAMDSFPDITNKIGLPKFPSLLNSKMTLKLRTDGGILIDSLSYNSNWHTAEAKNGGYALSRINPQGESEESNFQSSCAINGGSPGSVNCDEAPVLELATVLTKSKLKLKFNEGVSINSILYSNNAADEMITSSNEVVVTFSERFPERDTFTISIDVKDINDNVLIQEVKLYYTPFEVSSVVMENGNEMHLSFNKAVSEIAPKYIQLNNESPTGVALDSIFYVAHFATTLENRTTVPVQIKGVLDLNGDTLKTYTTDISFFTAEFGDVIFTELMPDPSPVVGDLPEEEYIELFNRTDFSINLNGWQLVKDDKNYALPHYQMSAFETLVLVTEKGQLLFPDTINSISLSSFPTLANSGMSLQMLSDKGALIDVVEYDNDWHENAFKGDGGFSLERIDTENPSQLGNWTSTCSPNGGTPGIENCAADENPDYEAPYIINAYAKDNNWLMLQLSEPIMSSELLNLNNYTISGGQAVTSAVPLNDPYITDQVLLGLAGSMADETLYELIVSDIADLSGNVIEMSTHQVAVCRLPERSEILINEIMYAPLTGEAEYVEIYNTTEVPFDLSQMKITKQESDGSWDAGKFLSDAPQLLLPHSYRALSADVDLLMEQYNISSAATCAVSGMTSLGNESDVVALLLQNATPIDELSYNDEWQSPLLNDTRGVALERLSVTVATNVSSNWFSASSMVNYGTPGALNSQQDNSVSAGEELKVSPEVFTPDGDGNDDFTTILIDKKYEGGIMRIQVFNHRGIVVNELVNNALIGSYSDVRWDGVDSAGERCPMGAYIVWIEIVMPQGDVVTKKMECVVSIRMK